MCTHPWKIFSFHSKSLPLFIGADRQNNFLSEREKMKFGLFYSFHSSIINFLLIFLILCKKWILLAIFNDFNRFNFEKIAQATFQSSYLFLKVVQRGSLSFLSSAIFFALLLTLIAIKKLPRAKCGLLGLWNYCKFMIKKTFLTSSSIIIFYMLYFDCFALFLSALIEPQSPAKIYMPQP